MNQFFSRVQCAYQAVIEEICKRFDITMLKSPCFKGKAVFGPVVSRRLGYSLGINAMKCKICTYDCVYCQVGQTPCRSTCRDSCVGEYELYCVVRKKLDLLKASNIPVDYITFIPSGEPTLDDNLAAKIKLLREFGCKIAVTTNGSLLWNDKVQEDLLFADNVSIKIDTVNEETWLKLNRPHSRLKFQSILDGIKRFSNRFQGIITTETMIVKDMNDTTPEIEDITSFLKLIPLTKSYFMVPTRPPVELYAIAPDHQSLSQISKYITDNLSKTEILFAHTEDEFYGAGDLEDELIATVSVHPMREEAIKKFIASKSGDLYTVQKLIEEKKLVAVSYNGNKFFYSASNEKS
jgi:wyosine [tRNA(Phe)-imidazoG37] synthetase (radical SAM superfamily)